MGATNTADRFGSEAVTQGVRVIVAPRYLPEHSSPDAGEHVWAYRIRIANERDDAVQLLERRWIIVDADGEARVVEGEGVVGEQPRIHPGQSHEYESFCPLESEWGTMEGSYLMVTDAGERFAAEVARFYLAPPGA